MNRKVFLVSCTKKKTREPSTARNLYVSPWFKKARRVSEKLSDEWFILSAFYGLLAPTRVIKPYNKTLLSMSDKELRIWSKEVLENLYPRLQPTDEIVFLAGTIYRKYLQSDLENKGYKVSVPFKHLGIGSQLKEMNKLIYENN